MRIPTPNVPSLTYEYVRELSRGLRATPLDKRAAARRECEARLEVPGTAEVRQLAGASLAGLLALERGQSPERAMAYTLSVAGAPGAAELQAEMEVGVR